MLQREFLDILESSALGTKEHVCREGPRDMQPFVVAFRGESPVALVTVGQLVKEHIIQVGAVMAGGLDADRIGMVFETIEKKVNVLTGKETGEITESISVVAGNRAGDIAMMHMPFRFVDTTLTWLEGVDNGQWSTFEPGVFIGGMMPEQIRRFMAMASGAQDFPFTDETERNKRDITVAQYLGVRGNAVMLYSDTSARTDFLREHGIQVLPVRRAR